MGECEFDAAFLEKFFLFQGCENGVFVPYRKQAVLTKNGENEDLHSTHKNKGLRSSEPGN